MGITSIPDENERPRVDELHQGEPDPGMFAPPKDFLVKDQNRVAAPAVATQ